MSILKSGISITKRNFLANLIIVSVFFTLYLVFTSLTSNYIVSSFQNQTLVSASFQFVVGISIILIAFFNHRIPKKANIYSSMLTAVILTGILLFVSNVALKTIIVLAIAASLGIGLSSAVTYFWNSTTPEERGRIAGLIGAVALPFEFMISYLIIPSLGFPSEITLIIIVNLGVAMLALLRRGKALQQVENKIQKGNYHEKRAVLLYFIPWIVFSLINVTIGKSASINISGQTSMSFHIFLLELELFGVILGAAIGGIAADFVGRRIALASGLSLYGISAALTGLFPNNEMFPFVYLTSGLSWGFLFALYMFVIWGDLANNDNYVRMYSLGLSTYFLSSGLGSLIPVSVPLAVGSLISCLVVFLLNIPIALAPELALSDFLEKTRLTQHMKAIRKIQKQNQG